MDFETALKFFSEGETLARGSWTSEHQNISLIGENKNFFLSSADIKADDWFILNRPFDCMELVKTDVSLYMAMEYLAVGYKIRRSDWDNNIHIFQDKLYGGDSLHIKQGGDIFSLEDVMESDWSVYK